MDTSPSSGSSWRWLVLWCALLLPLALVFPPIPVDETRYLTAAWEMFNSGQWLVPTVNGKWYSDKSPLLFWLIAGGWKIVGVHTWVARVEALAIALGILLALRRMAARLGLDASGPQTAMWLLAGCLGFSAFSTAIMFDLLLTLCVLGALHALLDLDAGRWKRGIVALGIAIGLGILAKGPVMLLHIVAVGLLAPLWSETAQARKLRWYAALFAGLLIGLGMVACWLLPAAAYAGPTYWQPLVDKVAGRVANSFSHKRSWWWYLPWIPLLLLPWMLALRAPFWAWAGLWRGRTGRFVACWWVVPFVAFCAISGKQIHYLLPLLPAWALTGAWLLQRQRARVRGGLFGLFALLVAGLVVALPWLAARRFGYPPEPAIATLALVGLLVAVLAWRRPAADVRLLALSATALMCSVMLAAALSLLPSLEVRPEAAFVKQALRERVPLVTVGSNNGLFGYAARLHQPVPWIPRHDTLAWARAHPEGIIMSLDEHDEPQAGAPLQTWPYFLSGSLRIAAWRARDVSAAHPESP